MKLVFLIIIVAISTSVATGQLISSEVDIITIYSQNNRFYLKSIPYDDESPSLRGKLDIDSALPEDKILKFFQTHRFDTREIPKVFAKWYVDNNFFYFRKENDVVARQEGEQERVEKRQEFEKRLTLESINGVYIPASLGECFPELDKRISEIDKKELQALPKREDMIRHHLTLGMWMRNNWVLWSGSRLSKYFHDKGVSHPEEMSSIIMYHYHDWLNGKKDTWKEWENQPHKRTPR